MATDQNRNKVMMLLAFGWTNERIAKALAITPPTLRKNYFRELKFRDEARDRLRGNMIQMLWNSAADGNVAAMKEFWKLIVENDLMMQLPTQSDKPEEDGQKRGKKEQALADALIPDATTPMGELIARRQANQKLN